MFVPYSVSDSVWFPSSPVEFVGCPLSRRDPALELMDEELVLVVVSTLVWIVDADCGEWIEV